MAGGDIGGQAWRVKARGRLQTRDIRAGRKAATDAGATSPETRMTRTDMPRTVRGSNSPVAQIALETAAVTRLVETEGILDYSGHVSTRIPGRDAFVIQIGSTSRAEVEPGAMLVCDYDGKVLEGD